MQGSEAVAAAAIAAGCRFFTGYPMLPFTGLLEAMSKQMPAVGGVCVNASSEMEGVNMTIGAASAGARAGTGSCGQGISLMQEAIGEAAQGEIPFVVFNMARGQQDYLQCTRGGGWGDYRTITLAPRDVAEAVEHTQLLFHLADLYRAPSILYGDYLVADTQMSVDISRREYGPVPPKDWAVTGRHAGTGDPDGHRVLWSWGGFGQSSNNGEHWAKVAEKFADIARTEARHESLLADDAEYLVVSWGTSSAFVDYVVEELRSDGVRIGSFRPVTLWPFPEDALHRAAQDCKRVFTFEVNAGQMTDDVRLSVGRDMPVIPLGGVSTDSSGMRQGPILQAPWLRDRLLQAMQGEI